MVKKYPFDHFWSKSFAVGPSPYELTFLPLLQKSKKVNSLDPVRAEIKNLTKFDHFDQTIEPKMTSK